MDEETKRRELMYALAKAEQDIKQGRVAPLQNNRIPLVALGRNY